MALVKLKLVCRGLMALLRRVDRLRFVRFGGLNRGRMVVRVAGFGAVVGSWETFCCQKWVKGVSLEVCVRKSWSGEWRRVVFWMFHFCFRVGVRNF